MYKRLTLKQKIRAVPKTCFDSRNVKQLNRYLCQLIRESSILGKVGFLEFFLGILFLSDYQTNYTQNSTNCDEHGKHLLDRTENYANL